jgi:hypothetical protein
VDTAPHPLDAGSTHTSVQMSGYDAVPWPEWLHNRPALVVPQLPGLARPIGPAEGWSASPVDAAARPRPGWRLSFTGRQVVVVAPSSNAPWFEGCPLLTREWRRAATAQRAALLISGPFPSVDRFADAARAGALRLLLIGVH